MLDETSKRPKPAYVHQEHPRVMYGLNGAQKLVESPGAEKELSSDWTRTAPLPEKAEDAAGPARAAEVRTGGKATPPKK